MDKFLHVIDYYYANLNDQAALPERVQELRIDAPLRWCILQRPGYENISQVCITEEEVAMAKEAEKLAHEDENVREAISIYTYYDHPTGARLVAEWCKLNDIDPRVLGFSCDSVLRLIARIERSKKTRRKTLLKKMRAMSKQLAPEVDRIREEMARLRAELANAKNKLHAVHAVFSGCVCKTMPEPEVDAMMDRHTERKCPCRGDSCLVYKINV